MTKCKLEALTSVANPDKGRVYYWSDTEVSGLGMFGLMATANGARSYVIQYRNGEGQSRRLKLKAKMLGPARREASRLFDLIDKGKDPAEEKRRERDARYNTLRAVTEKYLAHPDVKNLRSVDEMQRVFEGYVFPSLGSTPITKVTRSAGVSVHRKVREKNGPRVARHG